MMDIVITNGLLVDGTGTPAIRADVGITGDVVTAIGDLEGVVSGVTIDATGRVVSPGFIDMHTHSDFAMLLDGHAENMIRRGVTTEVTGNCGVGAAPVSPEHRGLLLEFLTAMIDRNSGLVDLSGESFGDYLSNLSACEMTTNIAPLATQGAIRIAEMGFSADEADTAQTASMREMAAAAMRDGALGISTGLIYLPGIYTTTEELTAVTAGVKEYGGFYVTHMRSEGDLIFEAIDEAVAIATGADVPLHISHLKLSSASVRGQTERLFARLERAETEGLEVSFDAYPYESGETSLSALLPSWVFEGGMAKGLERLGDKSLRKDMVRDMTLGIRGWQNLLQDSGGFPGVTIALMSNEANKEFEGKNLAEVADIRGADPFDALFDLLISEGGGGGIIIKLMDEDDVDAIIAHPRTMIGSDGLSLPAYAMKEGCFLHPRYFGTNTKILRKYVREKKLLTLEDAVRKMTLAPAKRLKLHKRGTIEVGNYADVIVFDKDAVRDNATYGEAKQSTGIEKVIINGKLVLDDDKHTETFPGRVVGR
jgi:N-acyl-D-amino-acid deacylase